MVDHLFDAMEWFVNFMNGISLADFVATTALMVVLSYVQVLAHEFGHAIAARCLGIRVVVIRVGGPLLGSFMVGSTRVEIGAPFVGGPGGYMLHSGSNRTPVGETVISLAGPLATLLCAGVFAWAGANTHGNVSTALVLVSLEALWATLTNLIPNAEGSVLMNDGRSALTAWSFRHEFARLTPLQREALQRTSLEHDAPEAKTSRSKAPQPDPRHATSKAPPGF